MTDTSAWLLLHGTPMTPEVWDGVRPALEAIRPVHAPSLPLPAGPTGAQTDIAERVLAGVAAPGRLHVVGHSFGGQVALEVVVLQPDRVASLTVLCSRAAPFPPFAAAAASLRAGDPVDPDASVQRWFLSTEVAEDGPVVRYARRCVAGANIAVWADELDAIATYDRRPELAHIGVPTTIVCAAEDQVGTTAEMSAIARAIPGATYEQLPAASHMSPFLDPDALAARLIAAAARHSRAER